MWRDCPGASSPQSSPHFIENLRVPIVCDLSHGAAQAVAKRFHVPRFVTDYNELLNTDVDAVLLCHGDPKTQVALARICGREACLYRKTCLLFASRNGGNANRTK